MSADPYGRLARAVKPLQQYVHSQIGTVTSLSPFVVTLDTGQAIPEPARLTALTYTEGQRVVAVPIQDQHDYFITPGPSVAPPAAPVGFSFGEGASGSDTWGGLGLPDAGPSDFVVAAVRAAEPTSLTIAGHSAGAVWDDASTRWYYFLAFDGPVTSSDVVSWGSEMSFVVVTGGGSIASTGSEIVTPDAFSSIDFVHAGFSNAVIACLGPFLEAGTYTEMASGTNLDVGANATGAVEMFGAGVAWAEIT